MIRQKIREAVSIVRVARMTVGLACDQQHRRRRVSVRHCAHTRMSATTRQTKSNENNATRTIAKKRKRNEYRTGDRDWRATVLRHDVDHRAAIRITGITSCQNMRSFDSLRRMLPIEQQRDTLIMSALRSDQSNQRHRQETNKKRVKTNNTKHKKQSIFARSSVPRVRDLTSEMQRRDAARRRKVDARSANFDSNKYRTHVQKPTRAHAFVVGIAHTIVRTVEKKYYWQVSKTLCVWLRETKPRRRRSRLGVVHTVTRTQNET